MDIKMHILICLFISMLVSREKNEVVIRIGGSYLETNEVVVSKII